MSRGAAHVWFAENATPALAALRQNLAALRISQGFTLEDRGVGAMLQTARQVHSRWMWCFSIRRMRLRTNTAGR